MKRYTIRRQGTILGTYPGNTEAEALDACVSDGGVPSGGKPPGTYLTFDDFCEKTGLTRDDHKAELVKE